MGSNGGTVVLVEGEEAFRVVADWASDTAPVLESFMVGVTTTEYEVFGWRDLTVQESAGEVAMHDWEPAETV